VSIHLHCHAVRNSWLLFFRHSSQSEKLVFWLTRLTSQIASDLWLISNLQHRLSENSPSLPCSEEWLVILCWGGTDAKVKKLYFNRHDYFIITSQIANDLWLLSTLQHRLSEHPPSLPCSEEWLVILCPGGTATKVKKIVFWSIRLFHPNQPNSKQSLINFKLAAQAKWTSTFITILWGIADYSQFRCHGSLSKKIVFWSTRLFHHNQPDSK